MRIEITDHAYKRWLEYTGIERSKRNLSIDIKKRLHYELKNGLHIDRTNAAHMPFIYHLVAVLTITNQGWKVITFHHNEYGYVNEGITMYEKKAE